MNTLPSITSLSSLLLLLLVYIPITQAKESDDSKTWEQCSSQQLNIQTNNTSIIQTPFPDAIYLEADTGTIRKKGISKLQGNVIIQQNDTQFNADSATFNRDSNLVIANGHVVLQAPNLEFRSETVHYNLENQTGSISQAEYKVGTQDSHGTSHKIKLISKDELTLSQATFSNCPAPNPTWYIKSSEININNKTQKGYAKDVTLNVAGIPIFYFPSFSFPLNNNRKSGFLSPSIRLQSNTGISLPYYFNLAPNYDATVTLSNHKRQGLSIDSEFRYLTPTHQGIIEYNFIPKDDSFDNEYRDYFNLEHRTTVSKQTSIKLNAEGISDKEYFNDLSESLETSSRSSLQRRFEIVHKNDPWKASVAVEDYQILDTKDSPYAKLPELKLSYKPKTAPKALKLSTEIELINFDKDNAVTGTRTDIKFSASKKWGTDAWFFKPTISLESTHYSFRNDIGDSSLSRTLPTLTLDTGLFFDREITTDIFSDEKTYTQTLEPRFYYSYTPFKDQSNIPIFDTAKSDFSATTQLFSENRFTGKDRIADTNQLTFAVSSRLQDRDNGKELLLASIGQVINFSDRKVTLPNGTIQTGKRSDLVLELSGRLNDNFKIASTILWSHEKKTVSNYEFRLNYHDKKKRIANISYRKLDTRLNTEDDSKLSQLTFSTSIPMNNKWSFVGRLERDIENKRNLETLIGLEYQDCCWRTRLVAKRFLNSDNSYETPIFIEFELKGLGNLGSSAKRELKDKIYGYDDY